MNPSGFLLIDKPAGWTSHDVVAKIRRITGIKRVGHGGTLDPLATGLLVVGLGTATKELEQFVQGEKGYLATVRLGATSSTDDAEGEVVEQPVAAPPDEATVREALESFRGEQDQLPPVYSALKTAGRKHYQLARAGKEVERKLRQAVVYEIELVAYDWPEITFRCRVSKGTYIRAMARDLGEHLGTGGYLAALRRETVGLLGVDQAVSLEELAKDWQRHLRPVS